MDWFKDKYTKDLENQIRGRESVIECNKKLIDTVQGDKKWAFSNRNIDLTKDKLDYQDRLELHKSRLSINRLTWIIIGVTAANILLQLTD